MLVNDLVNDTDTLMAASVRVFGLDRLFRFHCPEVQIVGCGVGLALGGRVILEAVSYGRIVPSSVSPYRDFSSVWYGAVVDFGPVAAAERSPRPLDSVACKIARSVLSSELSTAEVRGCRVPV